MPLQHVLVMCHGRDGKTSSKANKKPLSTQPEDSDTDMDEDEEDAPFELSMGENWLRITKAKNSVLYTQEEEEEQTQPEAKSFSQQTTQDPPMAGMSQNNQEMFQASILSAESLELPNEITQNCYICLDVTMDGKYLAVKDMRWGENTAGNTQTSIPPPTTSSVGLWCSETEEWTALPRRQLAILQEGDKICTYLEERETTALTLEYQTRETASNLKTQASQSQMFYSQQSVFQTQQSMLLQSQQQDNIQTQETEYKASQETDLGDEDEEDLGSPKKAAADSPNKLLRSESIDICSQDDRNLEGIDLGLSQEPDVPETPTQHLLSQERLNLLMNKNDNGDEAQNDDGDDKAEEQVNASEEKDDDVAAAAKADPAEDAADDDDDDHSSLTSDDDSDSDKTVPMSQMPETGITIDSAKQGIMETQEEEEDDDDDDDRVDKKDGGGGGGGDTQKPNSAGATGAAAAGAAASGATDEEKDGAESNQKEDIPMEATKPPSTTIPKPNDEDYDSEATEDGNTESKPEEDTRMQTTKPSSNTIKPIDDDYDSEATEDPTDTVHGNDNTPSATAGAPELKEASSRAHKDDGMLSASNNSPEKNTWEALEENSVSFSQQSKAKTEVKASQPNASKVGTNNDGAHETSASATAGMYTATAAKEQDALTTPVTSPKKTAATPASQMTSPASLTSPNLLEDTQEETKSQDAETKENRSLQSVALKLDPPVDNSSPVIDEDTDEADSKSPEIDGEDKNGGSQNEKAKASDNGKKSETMPPPPTESAKPETYECKEVNKEKAKPAEEAETDTAASQTDKKEVWSSQQSVGEANIESGSWKNSQAEKFIQSLKEDAKVDQTEEAGDKDENEKEDTQSHREKDIKSTSELKRDNDVASKPSAVAPPSSTMQEDESSKPEKTPPAKKPQRRESPQAEYSQATEPDFQSPPSTTGRRKRKASSSQETPQPSASARKSRRTRSTPPKSDSDNSDYSKIAKKRYLNRFQSAIDHSVVTVASSNLSKSEAAILESLTAKRAGPVKLKLSDDVDASTTLCVIASDGKKSKGTKASIRSKKAMRSTLLGIPIVTPEWLKACKKHGEIVPPETFIHTLPTKAKQLESTKEIDDGVLKLAAAWARQPEAPSLPFQSMFVYLCGNFKLPREELTHLLMEGAATMLHTPLATSNKLKELSKLPQEDRSKPTVVIVCGDSRVSLTKSLEKDIKMAVEGTSPALNVQVVDSLWVMESITCAKALRSNLFQPSAKKDLWELCMTKEESMF